MMVTAQMFWMTTIAVAVIGYLIVTLLAAWIERPAVVWDEREGRWRSARLMQRERDRA